jgi:type IV pilus biogenesis protein CpaD/CtpE
MSMRALLHERSVLFALALAVAAAALAAGCAKDEGRERSGKAVGTLKETRAELANASKQVDEVLAAASGVQSGQGDLKAAYDKYKKEVAQTEEAAQDSRKRAQDMRARSAEYQNKWQQEMSKVTNPDLKAAAQARAAKVRGRYEMISAKAQDARAAYEPFMTDLKDLQTYLSNDLTPAAVQAASPVFEKVNASGQVLKQKLAALRQELDDVAAEMSPSGGSGT